jgi:hypothetical protein
MRTSSDHDDEPATNGGPAAALTRRHLLAGVAAIGATIIVRPGASVGAAARQLAGEGAPVSAPALRAGRLRGLIHRKGQLTPQVLPWLSGGAVALDHAALAPSSSKLDLTPVAEALDTYQDLGLRVRLRVKFGTGAAPWLADRCGVVRMNHARPPAPFRPVHQAPVAAWWRPAYLDELGRVMGALAKSFDGHPALADVNLAIGTVFSAGDGMLFLHENAAALRAAGYRLGADLAARHDAIDLYAETWRVSGVWFGLAPFETIEDDGTRVVSNIPAIELAEHARARLADRLVLGHHGLVGDVDGQPLGTSEERALFRWMAHRSAEGWPVGVQVEGRERIRAETRGTPSVDGTVLAAVQWLGADSVEIPADPSPLELRRWSEYFSIWPTPSSRWPKPAIVGLVDRDGGASRYAYRDHAGHFGGIVGRVDHAEIHLAPGRFDFSAVDRVLEEAEAYGLALRLRLYLGIQVVEDQARSAAPAWLLDRVGSVPVADPHWVGPGRSTRFWHPEYRGHYRELMAALAERYDDDDRLAEVHGLPGALIGGETMIQRYDNAEALRSAGYPGWEADRDLQIAYLQDFAELWPRTGCYLAINAFQRIGQPASVETSFEIVDAGLAAMGGRLRPANNSLVANDRLVEQRGGAYGATYQRMRDDWGPAGVACQIQTGNPTNLDTEGDGSGTLDGTVRYAATVIGASSVELPVTYTEHLGKLMAWAALFPGATSPTLGPIRSAPGPRAITTPSPTDPSYCRGRVMGELFGDGHLGSGAWRFTGDPGRRAELQRCLEVLGWPSGGAPGEIQVPFTVLASGWSSLVPARGASRAELQGWCGGVVEGEGSTAGQVWDLTARFASGPTVADRERLARDKTVWCAEQWRRLGADPVTAYSGTGDEGTWRVSIPSADFEIARAIRHYVSWGRVPGGRA